MRIVKRTEGLPGGGWHTVRRVLVPPDMRAKCPNCGNVELKKFETYTTGSPPTLRGFLCMACEAPA